jgi:hypothetical protein
MPEESHIGPNARYSLSGSYAMDSGSVQDVNWEESSQASF